MTTDFSPTTGSAPDFPLDRLGLRNENAFMTVGRGIAWGLGIGAFTGACAGLSVGTAFVPILGTLFGLASGAIAGAVLGTALGLIIGVLVALSPTAQDAQTAANVAVTGLVVLLGGGYLVFAFSGDQAGWAPASLAVIPWVLLLTLWATRVLLGRLHRVSLPSRWWAPAAQTVLVIHLALCGVLALLFWGAITLG